jgi:hypothetical protein
MSRPLIWCRSIGVRANDGGLVGPSTAEPAAGVHQAMAGGIAVAHQEAPPLRTVRDR